MEYWNKIKEFLLAKTPIDNWATIGLVIIVLYHTLKLVF